MSGNARYSCFGWIQSYASHIFNLRDPADYPHSWRTRVLRQNISGGLVILNKKIRSLASFDILRKKHGANNWMRYKLFDFFDTHWAHFVKWGMTRIAGSRSRCTGRNWTEVWRLISSIGPALFMKTASDVLWIMLSTICKYFFIFAITKKSVFEEPWEWLQRQKTFNQAWEKFHAWVRDSARR